MSSAETKLENKAAEMRRLFDCSFATPRQHHVQEQEQMLAITLAGECFAVRLREISGLAVSKGTILPVPSRVPELLGITGIRGTVVPVFGLATLLGLSSAAGQPRWLIFCGGKQTPIALAFDELESHFEVSTTEIYPRQADLVRRYVHETARDGSRLRGVIDVTRLMEFVKTRSVAGPNR